MEANNSPNDQTTNADRAKKNNNNSAIKYILIGAAVPILGLIIYRTVHFKGSDNNFAIHASDTVANINISGGWFLQPINRSVALSLANVNGEITLNIIDSIYCTVILNQNIGNVVLSRRYKIQNLNLTFDDPIAGKKVTYTIDSLIANTNSFVLRDKSGKELFKVWSYNVAGEKLSSENVLQRNAFLYPTISSQEITDKPYTLKMAGRFYKKKTSKINISKLF